MRAQSFESWQLAFRKRPAFVAGTATTLAHTRLVSELLADIEDVPLARRTHAALQHNVLLACYSAELAPDPERDEAANDRARLRSDHKALLPHAQSVRRVLDFATKHREMTEKAMSCSTESNVGAISSDGQADVEELVRLLSRYGAGLEAVMDVDHPIHIAASDFRYGPFEFDVSVQTWHFKVQDVNSVGLMFHLAYVFRYFTCEDLPENIDAQFRDDTGVLDLHGHMLDCGEPHSELVAPLVNAVFKAKFSAARVRDRLRDLSRKSKGSHYFNRAHFVGWALPK